jgi:predicted DsbA family dithiol-disulfide isomerase
MTLEDLFRKKGMIMDVDKAMAQLKETAQGFGLPFGVRRMTYNSRLAQELGLWAESKGKGHEFHNQAFRAYFVAGQNLARQEVLVDMAAHAGLDRAQAGEILDKRLFKAAVDRDWEAAGARGIMAVPTFYMGLDRLVGAQPYEAMEAMVKKHLPA